MKKIYIIAGEPSGDFLGACVLQELQKYSDFEIFGVGGNLMKTKGLKSLFDIKEISVGGLVEVIPHIFHIKTLINKTVNDIIAKNPDVLFTIDSPGFCFRVAKLVRKKNPNIKLIHLVAPSVWAWRQGRAKGISKLYDHLLTLFDFEPKYFTKFGLKTTFVGHPAIEYFEENDYSKEDTLLLLPGSRKQEIESLLPIFLNVSEKLSFEKIIIPTLPSLLPILKP
ncbi:MAG: lipid-A-disaccharide synthase, partial [Alphaproteobacteria bacterium]|nr:lipid-A-disaccharide synthase [Alphaproteobacteria bacterium]